MSNELLLELFDRIKTLEKKVDTLEILIKENNVNKKITRNISRDYVISKLKEKNDLFFIKNGNRASNADIILTSKKDNIILKAKFYHSKSHIPHKPSGWHRIEESDIRNEEISLYIFNIDYNEEFYTFFFTRNELINYVKDKEIDKNSTYHFYFHIEGDKAIDYRDEKSDVTNYLNRWNLPTEIINKYI